MNNAELLNSIADIELPAPPNWQPAILIGIIIFILLFLMLLILQQRSKLIKNKIYKHHQHSALEQLEKIQQHWKIKSINNRETAYQLAAVLRLGLKLEQLQANACPNILIAQRTTWHDTVTQLNKLRYQSHQKDEIESHTFAHIQHWLSLMDQPNEHLDEQIIK